MSSTLPTIQLFDKHPDSRMQALEGKRLSEGWEPTILARKRCRVEGAGKLLFDYLPGVVDDDLSDRLWPILSPIKVPTNQRATAAGSFRRPTLKNASGGANPVLSATLGATEGDAGGRNAYCRQTVFTKENTDLFGDPAIKEMFRTVESYASVYEFERYTAQRRYADQILPNWMINDTAWTTLTVNNNYATGIHVDSGDLDAGVSCLLVLRRGDYAGALLTFPQWEVGVDLQDGDLLLMDAHEWHANTPMVFHRDEIPITDGLGDTEMVERYGERVSVVFYLREGLVRCGTAAAEEAKHQREIKKYAAKRQEVAS